MSPRRRVNSNRGEGLLNSVINSVPVELHLPGYQFCGPGTDLKKRLSLGQSGVNALDSACREHDIVYEQSNHPQVRDNADRVLENRAWSRFNSSDADFGEKSASWLVTTAMKAKRKIGGACGFKKIVGAAKKSLQKSLKECPTGTKNIGQLIRTACASAKKYARKFKNKREPRIINIPKSGGIIPFIPIAAGLSALGTLVGGVGGIVKAIRDINANTGSPVHLGKGLYLHPHKAGSYKIMKSIISKVTTKSRKRVKSKSHSKTSRSKN